MGPHRRNSNEADHDPGPTGQSQNTNFDKVNGPWPCGVPKGHSCIFTSSSCNEMDSLKITQDDVKNSDAVKIVCSNEQCPTSPFLHLACFNAFEESILVYLKNQGRARGWSEKQRAQNLWNKRGYDLIFKACECSCDHGYVRKDLDWTPACGGSENPDAGEVNGAKRKRKKSKSQNKPTITIGLPTFTNSDHHQVNQIC